MDFEMNGSDLMKSEFKKYLERTAQNEENYTGIESEEESGYSEDGMPYNVADVRVEQKMITVFQIEYWIKNGLLKLQPEYQRNMVWDQSRKSALIESMMLRIPIPAFYLDETADGSKNVIDGMQRLSTIHEFLNDEFKLKKMQYLSGCEKKKFSQLDKKFKSYILDTTLAVNTLDARCPQMVKFDVFRRVNTGGLPLNPQEIRNIMAAPKVRRLLKAMSGCDEFKSATGGGINDVRMGAQELCLRYLALFLNYDWERKELIQYIGLLKTMDATVLALNEMSEEQLDKILRIFKNIMGRAEYLLGELSFKKPDNNKVNASLFTAWSITLTHICMIKDYKWPDPETVRRLYLNKLEKDGEFYQAITSSTGTRKNILISLNAIRNIMEEVV